MRTTFRARDLTWLVALAVQAPTIVLAERAVLVLVLLPFLARAVRAFGKLDRRAKAAVLAIGAGASAVATTLFRSVAPIQERGRLSPKSVLRMHRQLSDLGDVPSHVRLDRRSGQVTALERCAGRVLPSEQ